MLQAQKMESVGKLAGGMAHEFNNMLGIIIGHAELAAMQIDPEDPLYQGLQEILKASYRSSETVRQLLAFARKQTTSPKVLDLNDMIPGMIKMLQRLIGEESEAQALAERHNGEIHLLLTDVVMPEMNGRELMEKMQALRPWIKALFMSGYTADVVVHHGVLDKGGHFIEKPFSPGSFVDRVRMCWTISVSRSY